MAMANVPKGDGTGPYDSSESHIEPSGSHSERVRNGKGEPKSSHAVPNGDSPMAEKSSASTDRYGFLGGNQYTDPNEERRIPQETIRKREMKWLDMFEDWDKWMSKKFKKVKERCRKGIPPSVRAKAWGYLCGGEFVMKKNVGVFQHYLELPGDPKCMDDIHKDLDRQFPLHEMFLSKGGHGQESLFEVLKAYSLHRPADGYCQAQAPIAAILLMHMPSEQAFWCLVAICDKYLPGYYSPGLEAVQLDGDVLFGLLKRASTSVYKHLKKQHVEPIMYMTEWFMCAFVRSLPWTTVLRIWDQFLCEGIKVLFRVALVLVKMLLEGQDNLSQCPSFYETLERLRMRKLPPELQDDEFIFREALHLSVNEKDMQKEHLKQVQRKKAEREAAERESSTGGGSSGKKGKTKKRTS